MKSNPEEEYFKQEELAKLRKLRKQAAEQTKGDEASRLKELHWMRCPKCGMELAEVDFRGVRVDTCFNCGGMFFDQGEVEKIQEKQGWLGGMMGHLFGNK